MKYLRFQHCKSAEVTHSLLQKVQNYKRILLQRVVSVFQEHDIAYSLDAGSLLESLRGKVIPHDDDLDVRFDHRDWDKWEAYCTSLKKVTTKDGQTRYVDVARNLTYDYRGQDFKKQKYNGIQAYLVDHVNPLPPPGIQRNKMNEAMHVDIVTSKPGITFWNNVEHFFDKPLHVQSYLDTDVTLPSAEVQHTYLSKKYGATYMTPDRPCKADKKGYYPIPIVAFSTIVQLLHELSRILVHSVN